jgi:hypothetical protein
MPIVCSSSSSIAGDLPHTLFDVFDGLGAHVYFHSPLGCGPYPTNPSIVARRTHFSTWAAAGGGRGARCRSRRRGRTERPHAAAAAGLITSALDDQSLRAIRATDPGLYREFSIDLWSALSQRCKFEDRFQYHPGGGGMRQAFMNVEIANFDRFLITWPIQTDFMLASIRTDVGPWWEEWRKWIEKKQSRE